MMKNMPFAISILLIAVPLLAAPPAEDPQALERTLEEARAVPYVDPGTGKFEGFSVEQEDSANFEESKIRRGDRLTLQQEEVVTEPNSADVDE